MEGNKNLNFLESFPRSGSKSIDIEKERRRRVKVGDYDGQYIRLIQKYSLGLNMGMIMKG